MRRLLVILIFFTVFPNAFFAQPVCHRSHYSVKDGLPHRIVSDIMQDKRGQIWVATWNGLCKFDGYAFTNYLSEPNSDYCIGNNRIVNIIEDHYGYIWALSYDGAAHRFDPQTEILAGLLTNPDLRHLSFRFEQIVSMPSGKVWLLSEKTGCICVLDSTLKIELYHIETKRLKSEKVLLVHEDQQKQTWLLTTNGIAMISPESVEPVFLFSEDNQTFPEFWQSFYSVLEFDDEIWFGSNNGRIWKYYKDNGQFSLFELPASSNVICMEQVGECVVMATSENGLFVFDNSTDMIKEFNISNSALLSNQIHSIAADHLGNVWIATEQKQTGIHKLNIHTGQINYFESNIQDPNEYFTSPMFIIEDSAKRIWVHPKGGDFCYYDINNDALISIDNFSPSDSEITNSLHKCFCDRQGNLWLSASPHGLEKLIFDSNQFKIKQLNTDDAMENNDVRAVFEDRSGNLWISTKDGRVREFDSNRTFTGYLCHDGTIGNDNLLKGIVYCIYQDNDNNIWVGTKGDGVYRLQPEKKYKYKVTNYKNYPDNIYSLSNNNIYSIFQDRNKNIWIGTFGGGINLLRYDGNNDIHFIHYRNHLVNYPIDVTSRVRYITEDQSGKICVGTTEGLIMFDSEFISPETIVYHYYAHHPDGGNRLTNNDIQHICITKSGEMYLATASGGINKVEQHDTRGFPTKFKAYTNKNELPSNVTLSMIEDVDGTLWVSMENNISKFDPKKETFETFGEISRLIGSHFFSEGASVRLNRSEEMLFGFSKGILSFHPQQITHNKWVPPLVLNKFRLFNKDVEISEYSPLKKQIEYMDKLTLTNRQNFFSIEYAALDFHDPDNILYAYKLENLDEEWSYVQKQRIANYTNLQKGHYVFCVKSTNNDGRWVDNERRLPIEILPSFWQTNWAYFLYIVTFILLLVACFYIMNIFYRLKHKVELEMQLSELKIRYFTDISHEIRTPLTMITAPVDYLVHNKNTPPDIQKQLVFVARNTQRMLHIMNQMLDLRKFQHHRLKVEEIKIAEFTENVCKSFDKIAERKQFFFQFVNQAEDSTIWGDRDSIEKIIFNLLSNAFKYTPTGKRIIITVTGDDEIVSLSVEDEGKGMSNDKIDKIFTRFTTFNDDKNKPSTGIGLNMVKEIADRHHATVSVKSVPEKGSCFTVKFQKGYKHFGENIDLIIPTRFEHTEDVSEETPVENQDTVSLQKISSILIVEDDDQLRSFMRTILENEYRIFEAVDGEDGYRKAQELIPDFIISDVMMPNMDGLQMLQQLKTAINTCHIPVVLLTAKATIENKLEGLEYGADEYITKPFSVPYLRARIQNLLKQREQLQQLYCSNLFNIQNTFTPQQPCIGSQDEQFIHKVMQEIERNMDNSDYSINTMAAAVGVSRTVFLKKIKGLTGFTPVEFIRDIKLQRAAQLLSSRQLSIKEVIYMVGMTDAKYFRDCFKKKYGKTPSEYKLADYSATTQ